MQTGNFVTYFRVSTEKQGRSGLGIEAQQAAVAGYLNGGSWKVLATFTEIESGKRNDRPQLAAAMAYCRITGAKLLIAKIDRLSRNAAFLLGLKDAGIRFVAADNPSANELTVGILAVVAQAEREAISERTKAALSAAKARGTILGGFRGVMPPDPAKSHEVRRAGAQRFYDAVRPMAADLRSKGMTLREIAATMQDRQIMTQNGGRWTANLVMKVLAPA